MLGIHVAEGTAEGWFGPGKKSAIASIAVIAALLISVITAVILIAMNVGEGANVSQPNASAVAIAPAPVQTPSAVTNEPIPADVIKITAEELVKQFLANPDKYQKGTVFQVSGAYDWSKKFVSPASTDFFLGPAVETPSGLNLGVMIHVDSWEEKNLFKAFNAIGDGDQVVVQGTYYFFSGRSRGILLEKASLISVTPAK